MDDDWEADVAIQCWCGSMMLTWKYDWWLDDDWVLRWRLSWWTHGHHVGQSMAATWQRKLAQMVLILLDRSGIQTPNLSTNIQSTSLACHKYHFSCDIGNFYLKLLCFYLGEKLGIHGFDPVTSTYTTNAPSCCTDDMTYYKKNESYYI